MNVVLFMERLTLGEKHAQFSSVTQSCPTLCDPMNCSMPGLPVCHQPPESTQKPMPIESVMPSSHLILCCPLLLLPSIPPSISVFSNESVLPISWLKYWSFSFSISPSNEHPGLISFRMDWLDLLAVQGTLKSLLQHHSSKASILRILVESFPEVSWYPDTHSRHRFTPSAHPSMTATVCPRLLSSVHPEMLEPAASPSKVHPPYSLIHSDKVTVT